MQFVRIGPDRAYPLHFTPPQLLQLLQLLCVLLQLLCVSFCFWALYFEIIKFQPLIYIGIPGGQNFLYS